MNSEMDERLEEPASTFAVMANVEKIAVKTKSLFFMDNADYLKKKANVDASNNKPIFRSTKIFQRKYRK